MGAVHQTPWFCRSTEEWHAIVERLKQTPCPHCKVVGTLNRHGCWYGFDETSKQKTLRARRLFCSNRNARPGCGRTVSVWCADKIRRLSLSAGFLWKFLTAAAAGSVLAAYRALPCFRSDRTLQRIWTRFHNGQSKIRTALFGLGPPPELPATPPAKPCHRPAAHVLAHLQATFPHADSPIAAFQYTLRTFFI
jgi:hypothetical protein